eukprot:5206252-Pyramimonas_sp.AAC.1
MYTCKCATGCEVAVESRRVLRREVSVHIVNLRSSPARSRNRREEGFRVTSRVSNNRDELSTSTFTSPALSAASGLGIQNVRLQLRV